LAIAPVIVVILYIYFKDTYKKEPVKTRAISLVLGATVSLHLIFIISAIVSVLIPLTDVKSISQQFIKAFILVALVAAFSKYVIVK
jgi:RsiW-degrading membrane proteinase PrsW (M82 family)